MCHILTILIYHSISLRDLYVFTHVCPWKYSGSATLLSVIRHDMRYFNIVLSNNSIYHPISVKVQGVELDHEVIAVRILAVVLLHEQLNLRHAVIRGAFGSKPDDLQISATREDRTKRLRLMTSYGEIDITISKN